MGKGRAPCCDKSKVKTGPWSAKEDLTLITFIQKHGHTNWRSLPKEAGLLRCGKSCRLRWVNYLRPDLKRGPFSPAEEEMIIKLHQTLGNKWSKIASYFPGRTDNEIKNVWNTHFRKKLAKTGEDHKNQDEGNKDVSGDSSFSQSSSSMSSISREEDSPKEVIIDNVQFENFIPDELPLDMDVWRNWDMEDPFQFVDPLPMDQTVSQSSMPLIQEEDDGKKEMEFDQEWFKNLEKELGLDQTTTNEVFDDSYFEPFILF